MSRITSKTPKFFRIIRNIGLAVAAVSGVLLTAPIALPAGVITLAGYLATVGAVASAVAQSAKHEE